MLSRIQLVDTGPFRELMLRVAPRLNLLTGDNGLGKSFVLDILWYALTWTWAGEPPLPHLEAKVDARTRPGQGRYLSSWINYSFADNRSYDSGYHIDAQAWLPRSGAAGGPEGAARAEESPFPGDGLVVYARVDGGFAVWDSYRNRGRTGSAASTDDRPRAFLMSREEVWDELREGDRVLCSGLLRDWVSWQQTGNEAFGQLESALSTLSGEGVEKMSVGRPRRVTLDDVRDVPTLELAYGNVPITHASAGMRRLAALAYVLVWTWSEHRRAAELRRAEPVRDLVLLIDEVDAHLHPQWQRRVVPALLAVVRELAPELRVQLVLATHSPLVLASVESEFDSSRDQLVHFELDNGRLVAEEHPFVKHGDVVGWLVSDAFGLTQARGLEGQRAIEAAEAWMRGESGSLPEGLRSQAEIHAALIASLSEIDHFWPRWIGWTARHRTAS